MLSHHYNFNSLTLSNFLSCNFFFPSVRHWLQMKHALHNDYRRVENFFPFSKKLQAPRQLREAKCPLLISGRNFGERIENYKPNRFPTLSWSRLQNMQKGLEERSSRKNNLYYLPTSEWYALSASSKRVRNCAHSLLHLSLTCETKASDIHFLKR